MDGPDFLLGAFPLGNAFPVEGVEVVEHACSIDHEVILSVVDQHPRPPQRVDDVASVGSHDVRLEGVVDIVRSRNIVDVLGNAQFSATIVEHSHKSLVSLAVLPEIVGTHSSPELVSSVIVICHEVEIGRGLNNRKSTFL